MPTPADPIHPDQLGGEQRFRADLLAYLDSLPIGELAQLLGKLPSSRRQPLGPGMLLMALNEQLLDAYKLLPPPAGHPGPDQGRRRSLRQVVADRRAAHHTGPAIVGAGRVARRPPAAGRAARGTEPCGRGGRAAGARGAARPGHRSRPRRRPPAPRRPAGRAAGPASSS